MNAIVRHVRDIDAADRRVLEHVLGQKLQENQQVIFRILAVDARADAAADAPLASHAIPAQTPVLPDWCKVYDGLTDEQLAEVESGVLTRTHLTRPS